MDSKRANLTSETWDDNTAPGGIPGTSAATAECATWRNTLARVGAIPVVRDLFIVFVFCLFTAALTAPYVGHLKNAVVDTGDPYLVSWILWWDYHATFTNPLQLFHSNLFYPFRYTLAFSEHCYGIAFPFFPLFALGYKPLTVHAVAMFFGFALCGYGAFRLARTLTGLSSVAWIAGIIFAFVPYRFHIMSHLPYLFAVWIPLLFEALVLFVRERSWRRAGWLGFTFFMNGISTISWFSMSLVPLAIIAAILLTRYRLWRERRFWLRSAASLIVASIALLPFMLPYVWVMRLYGFTRTIEEIKGNSALPIDWLSVENRNKLWYGMGEAVPEGARFKLFPGLLPILFSGIAVFPRPLESTTVLTSIGGTRWTRRLDLFIFIAFAIAIVAVGFDNTRFVHGIFRRGTSEAVLTLFTVAIIFRCCLAYPGWLRAKHANFIETLRAPSLSDTFWIGGVLTVVGFCYSLGWNFFFYRICYDVLPIFRSMRMPSRGAMFAYLGLALLAGLGVKRASEMLVQTRRSFRPLWFFTLSSALLLIELNAAPLKIVHGEAEPDAVTLALKQTSMRGGIVILPAGPEVNHRYILRAADHQKPLVVGTSGFNSPFEEQIEIQTANGALKSSFMDFLESVPTSYVVIENRSLASDRRWGYEAFLSREVCAGRLAFLKRFPGQTDLYAVTKTEPELKSTGPLPFAVDLREWSALVETDAINLLGHFTTWSQRLVRLHVATSGTFPRFSDFIRDVKIIGHGVVPNFEERDELLERNFQEFVSNWMSHASFKKRYDYLPDEDYVRLVYLNAGLTLPPKEQSALVGSLKSKAESRRSLLMKLVDDPRYLQKEQNRSLVLLFYFAYFGRNPDDPPDRNFDGFNFWVQDLDEHHDLTKLSTAFGDSIEYHLLQQQH
ncbi:MAG: ArnT family glycosyltransferase [Pyrinomonadaceae bacterium]